MTNLVAGLVSCLLCIAIVPIIIYVSTKKGWYDSLDSRKIHTGNIPRLGGVGIFISASVTIVLSILISGQARSALTGLWPVGIAAIVVHGVGLADDFRDLRARYKFLAHVGAALIVTASGHRFTAMYLPWLGEVSLGVASYPLTIIWIVGVINAINMIDGMDGLSGGVSLIAAFSLGLILIGKGYSGAAVIAIALVGAIAGYLFYNFPPAKIFMGDSGSTLLGFTLAVLPLLGDGGGFWLLDGITALLLPIYDVFAAMLRRARKGLSLMSPDRWHFHHKLLRLKLEPRSILAIAYAITMGLGAVSISTLFLSPDWHFLAIAVAWLALLAFFIVLHYMKERVLSGIEKEERATLSTKP